MAKDGAGMVAFSDNLAVFGGYGIPHGPTQPGSSFIGDTGYTDGGGWTNELHVYNLKDGMYTWLVQNELYFFLLHQYIYLQWS